MQLSQREKITLQALARLSRSKQSRGVRERELDAEMHASFGIRSTHQTHTQVLGKLQAYRLVESGPHGWHLSEKAESYEFS